MISAINPCEEGTHDCFDKNFEECVFTGINNTFTCAQCESGYQQDGQECVGRYLQSINHATNQSCNQSINQSTNQSINHPLSHVILVHFHVTLLEIDKSDNHCNYKYFDNIHQASSVLNMNKPNNKSHFFITDIGVVFVVVVLDIGIEVERSKDILRF